MSIRSNWCEFDKDERKYIKKRDRERCVICGNKGALQIMHIFLSRAKGGKGDRKNGCLGCVKCHRIIDNPIGTQQNELSNKYLELCKQYLIEKENLTINNEFIESLKYKKQEATFVAKIVEKRYNRCKDCDRLEKRVNSNSTISTYYCRYRKMFISKNTKVCKNYSPK